MGEFDEKTEMSDYIDIAKYDEAEATHPFYPEMVEGMLGQLRKAGGKNGANVLEFGAGTGLFTMEIVKIPKLRIDTVEIDKVCFKYLQRKFRDQKINLIHGDAVTYHKDNFYDATVSCFAHDHIKFDQRFDYAKNIARNLKDKGVYIVSHEIIPKFSNEEERFRALRTFQGYIVWRAIQDGHEAVAGLELDSLKPVIAGIGDCKRHMEMFIEEMSQAGLKQIFKQKMGPLDKDDVGGVYVFVYQK